MNKVYALIAFSVLLLAPSSVFGASSVGILDTEAKSTPVQTEMVSMQLSGGAPVELPLASDPGNALGDSIDGYGFVLSEVRVRMSAGDPGPEYRVQFPNQPMPPPVPTTITDGEPAVYVESFFDVFFEIEVTDVDTRPGRDYAGQPDGATIILNPIAPAARLNMNSPTFLTDVSEHLAGGIPALGGAVFSGPATLDFPLGADTNGNGANDVVQTEIVSMSLVSSNPVTVSPQQTETHHPDSFFDIFFVIGDEGAAANNPLLRVQIPDLSGPTIVLVPVPGALPPLPGFPGDDNGDVPVGGEILPLDATSLLLAGAAANLVWITPIVLAGAGFAAFKLKRK